MTTFEIITSIFIIINTCLQLYWFRWSRQIHDRKHLTDDYIPESNTKQYTCSWCIGEQSFKDSQLERKPLPDRMATGLYGYCKYCKQDKLMNEI